MVIAELFGLTALAIAHPVLDVFGRAPEVFVEARANPLDIWVFAFAVVVGPPLLLFGLELAAGVGFGARMQRAAHVGFSAALVGLFVVRALRIAVGWTSALLLVATIVLAVGFSVASLRFVRFRQWVAFTAVAPLVFVGGFVLGSPAGDLAFGQDGSEAVVAEPSDATRRPIVLLVLDELPLRSLLTIEGEIDAERFPGFGTLAAESTWYRNATSVATYTHNAVPAILTGRYPMSVEVAATVGNHRDNIFRLLAGTYRLNVTEPQTNLCAVRRCDPFTSDNRPPESDGATRSRQPEAQPRRDPAWQSLIGDAIGRYREMVALHDVDPIPSVRPERLATTSSSTPNPSPSPSPTDAILDDEVAQAEPPSVQPERFASWIDRIDGATEPPQFSMMHVTLPHNPWFLDSNGTRYAVGEGSDLAGGASGRWSRDAGAAITARQRHLLQLRYVDGLITALRARLVELDVWSTATVIVTADHGAGFEPGGVFRIWDRAAQSDLVDVPLFVHGPDFTAGKRDDTPVQAVDIAPTIAGVASIRAPWTVDGFDLRSLPDSPRTTHLYGSTPDYGKYELIRLDVRDNLESLLDAARSDGDDGGGDLDVLRSGPSGDRIGTPLAVVEFAPATEGTARLRSPEALDFAPDDGVVAALVIGRVDAPDATAGTTIVLSVDGTIAATASTFRTDGGSIEFSALLPPEWMTRGSQQVRAFVELDDGRLAPLALTA
jgi:Sulfatase